MIRWTAPFVLLLTGCPTKDQILPGGESLYEHFPFDGVRTWEYISTDLEISYKLKGDMRADDPNPDVSADFNVYHIDYSTKCVAADPDCVDGALVRSIGVSSDVTNGVLIHSFVQGSVDISYDPPLVIAPRETKVGQEIETFTDGITWTSTLTGYETCEGIVNMQGDQFTSANCAAHIVLEDADSNADTNYGLAGEYWVSIGLGIIGLSLEGDDGQIWGLSKLECEESDDRTCNGEW